MTQTTLSHIIYEDPHIIVLPKTGWNPNSEPQDWNSGYGQSLEKPSG